MLTELQVIERLRMACASIGGQKAFARAHGFTPAYVHDVLHGRRPPADRILEALGLERIIIYRENRNVAADVASPPPDSPETAP
jgi:DNA-binding transcriptional regulator YdaS (Cro superfamily)